VEWNGEIWPANGEAVNRFYERLKIYSGDGVTDGEGPLSRPVAGEMAAYGVTIFSKAYSRTIGLVAADASLVFPDADDDATVAGFLNPRIFAHVGDGCKIFRIKFGDDVFMFSKRHGKWFLDDPTANLEMKPEPMARFFREIFTLDSTGVPQKSRDVEPAGLAITLYGDNASERVNFSRTVAGAYFVENDRAAILFPIAEESFHRLSEAAENLLKLHPFQIAKCDDISVFLPDSGEHFNFHDLKNGGKWQFTYAKDGDVKLREIDGKMVDAMLNFLEETESIGILAKLPTETKTFTITVNEFSTAAQAFNFYEADGRLFVETDGQRIKFEIESRFVAPFFHLVRANLLTIGQRIVKCRLL
jgi:hypothetical protein